MFEQEKKEKNIKRSEEILRIKDHRGKEERPELSDYRRRFSKKRGPSEGEGLRETFRMENSYGRIAIGSGPDRKMTVLVSEKRRWNDAPISQREKRLEESREIKRYTSRGRIISNQGSQERGAVAFRYDWGENVRNVLEKMDAYAGKHQQETLEEMTPFLAHRKDRERKKRLEEEIREERIRGNEQAVQALEKEKDRLSGRILEKEQEEQRLRLKLLAAVEEMKRDAGHSAEARQMKDFFGFGAQAPEPEDGILPEDEDENSEEEDRIK